jgi:hypothetical protein
VIVAKELIGKRTFAGIPSYVLQSGPAEESLYAVDSLGLVATKTLGRYTSRVSNIDQVISWPLKANKQWQNSFTRENSELSATRSVRFLMQAVGSENIAVKAGRLKTIKIEAYGQSSGRLFAEYWYSPEVKWFAKSRIYDRDFALVEEELLDFKSKSPRG